MLNLTESKKAMQQIPTKDETASIQVLHMIQRGGSIVQPPTTALLKEKLDHLVNAGYSTAYIMLAFVQLMRDGKVWVDLEDASHRFELIQKGDRRSQSQAIELYVSHFRGMGDQAESQEESEFVRSSLSSA